MPETPVKEHVEVNSARIGIGAVDQLPAPRDQQRGSSNFRRRRLIARDAISVRCSRRSS
jgi:hypothetical protein